MIKKSLLCVLLLTFAALSAVGQTSAAAQTSTSTGQISGVVKDPDQAVLAGAHVTVTNSTTKVKAEAEADSQGAYSFSSLPPGNYVVEADFDGFNHVASSELAVIAGQSVHADLVMAPAGNKLSVNVSADSQNAYRVDNVTPGGPLGNVPIVNLPYSVYVIPRQLIDDTQSRNFIEIAKYMPLISFREQQGPEILRPEARGMQGTNMQNDRKDGMGFAVTTPTALEEYERLEVFTGLGGELYGPTQPSGIFDFVTKRPTEERYGEFETDYESASIGTAHLDLGGRVGPNVGAQKLFGYRTNLLIADGDGYVNGSQLRRQLAAGAFDLHPLAHTTIEGNYSYYNLYQFGYPGWFVYTPTLTPSAKTPYTILPSQAPDPTVQGYGQSFAGVNMNNQIGEVRVKQDFSPIWHLNVGVLQQIASRSISEPVNVLTNTSASGSAAGYLAQPGFYKTYLENTFQNTLSPRFQVKSDLAYLTGHFKTWGIRHDVVIGSTGYRFATWNAVVPSTLLSTNPLFNTLLCPKGEDAACTFTGTGTPPAGTYESASIAHPLIDVESANGLPSLTKTNEANGIYVNSILHQQGFSLGDTITLTPHWLLRGSASEDWTWTNNYSLGQPGTPPTTTCTATDCTVLSNVKGTNFIAHGISSSGSIIFKPVANMTIYGTYADSLQAPDTPVQPTAPYYVINSKTALSPYRDQEEEIGYKAVFPRINFSTALFRIQRPYIGNPVPVPNSECPPGTITGSYTTCAISEITGTQINYGAEALLEGRVLDSLMIVAGIEVLNPKLTDTHNPLTNDKRFVGIPDYKSNILAEYRIPRMTGLYFNADWQYVGRRPLDDVNQHYTSQYNNFDVGFRYSRKVAGRWATWRIAANNATNVHYWSTVNPGSLSGLSTGNYLGFLGAPRLILASMKYDF
jgi:iron complex outermembrane recepter protein